MAGNRNPMISRMAAKRAAERIRNLIDLVQDDDVLIEILCESESAAKGNKASHVTASTAGGVLESGSQNPPIGWPGRYRLN